MIYILATICITFPVLTRLYFPKLECPLLLYFLEDDEGYLSRWKVSVFVQLVCLFVVLLSASYHLGYLSATEDILDRMQHTKLEVQ